MKSETLKTVENQLPKVFDRRGHPETWPDGLIVLPGDIDDPLSDPLDADLSELNADWQVGAASAPDAGGTASERLRQVLDELSDTFGPGDFPGAPVWPREPKFSPPTDCYAFYLPWHHFNSKTWGIYLFVEGIEALGHELVTFSKGALSAGEARHAARIFLFHHEAYHNAVETFAARLEVTHREQCYIGGFRRLYQDIRTLPAIHEEALANAYAALKVKSLAFARVTPTRRRTTLRRAAFAALHKLFEKQPRPYDDAALILASMDEWERSFQERLHGACFASRLPGLGNEIWDAFSHALHPSLSRNGAFSYVIHRSHPFVRNRAGVFYFDRRKFLQRLGSERPGRLVPGGKHQKWTTPDGLKVPIPTGELAHGTARSILKALGVLDRYGSVDRFMSGDIA